MSPTATVKLDIDGKEVVASETGGGPVDAIYKAIKQATGEQPTLENYSVSSITGGTDAQGEVSVRITQYGIISQGHGSDTDIVVASAKAYLNALNKLRWRREHPKVSNTKGI